MQAFLGIINYLGKFSPGTTEVCNPLQKLTSSRKMWMWKAIAWAVVESARVTMQAMAAATAERTQNVGPRLGAPIIKQPTFNWKAEDKYNEFTNFRLEVNYIFKS